MCVIGNNDDGLIKILLMDKLLIVYILDRVNIFVVDNQVVIKYLLPFRGIFNIIFMRNYAPYRHIFVHLLKLKVNIMLNLK